MNNEKHTEAEGFSKILELDDTQDTKSTADMIYESENEIFNPDGTVNDDILNEHIFYESEDSDFVFASLTKDYGNETDSKKFTFEETYVNDELKTFNLGGYMPADPMYISTMCNSIMNISADGDSTAILAFSNKADLINTYFKLRRAVAPKQFKNWVEHEKEYYIKEHGADAWKNDNYAAAYKRLLALEIFGYIGMHSNCIDYSEAVVCEIPYYDNCLSADMMDIYYIGFGDNPIYTSYRPWRAKLTGELAGKTPDELFNTACEALTNVVNI